MVVGRRRERDDGSRSDPSAFPSVTYRTEPNRTESELDDDGDDGDGGDPREGAEGFSL